MRKSVSSRQSEHNKVLALEGKVLESERKIQSLEHQLDWFKRQLFGRKSEKRILEPNPDQPLLNGFEPEAPPATEVRLRGWGLFTKLAGLVDSRAGWG